MNIRFGISAKNSPYPPIFMSKLRGHIRGDVSLSGFYMIIIRAEEHQKAVQMLKCSPTQMHQIYIVDIILFWTKAKLNIIIKLERQKSEIRAIKSNNHHKNYGIFQIFYWNVWNNYAN